MKLPKTRAEAGSQPLFHRLLSSPATEKVIMSPKLVLTATAEDSGMSLGNEDAQHGPDGTGHRAGIVTGHSGQARKRSRCAGAPKARQPPSDVDGGQHQGGAFDHCRLGSAHTDRRCAALQFSSSLLAASWRVYLTVSHAPGNRFSVMTATEKPSAVRPVWP